MWVSWTLMACHTEDDAKYGEQIVARRKNIEEKEYMMKRHVIE